MFDVNWVYCKQRAPTRSRGMRRSSAPCFRNTSPVRMVTVAFVELHICRTCTLLYLNSNSVVGDNGAGLEGDFELDCALRHCFHPVMLMTNLFGNIFNNRCERCLLWYTNTAQSRLFRPMMVLMCSRTCGMEASGPTPK